MIISQLKLIAVAGAAIVLALALTKAYYAGKEKAEQDCMAAEAEARQILEDKLSRAYEQNKELAKHLSKTMEDIDKASKARIETIIKYVKDDPDSDTVIFDADGLSILNSAQKGPATGGQ